MYTQLANTKVCARSGIRRALSRIHSTRRERESELRRNGVKRELTRENGALIMYACHNNSLCLSNLLVSDEFFIRLLSVSRRERERRCATN